MGIAVDTDNVYWANQLGGSIMKLALLTGGQPVALPTNEDYPQALAVDATNVYWSNFSYTGSVVKVPIVGGTKVTIASGAGMTNTSQMVIDGTNAYFTNLGDGASTGSVMKAPLVGGASSTIVAFEDYPSAIALWSGSVFYSHSGVIPPATSKVSVGGGAVTPLSSLSANSIAVDATGVYLATQTQILKVPLAGGTAVVLSAAQNSSSVIVDATNVYWANSTGDIMSTSKTP